MKRKLIRDDILNYLKDLAKEIKKEFGKNEKFELIVVGGASILLNYSFRDGTYDIDALKSGGNIAYILEHSEIYLKFIQ